MARTKGMLNLSGNLEVNAQAPLDARTIVPTEADLTVASNFPYPYVGLEVYVTGTNKKFRLVNLDTTQSSSWYEIGEGGGGGETYSDFTGATSSTAGAHGLVPAPSAGDEGKVLFGNGAWGALPSVDLSSLSAEAFILDTNEKAIGMTSDRKLLYQRYVEKTTPNSSSLVSLFSEQNLENCYFAGGYFVDTNGYDVPINRYEDGVTDVGVSIKSDGTQMYFGVGSGSSGRPARFIIRYTKTTDSPLPSDVKFAGVDENGNVILKKVVTGTTTNNTGEASVSIGTRLNNIMIGEGGVTIDNGHSYRGGNVNNVQVYVDGSNLCVYVDYNIYYNKPFKYTVYYTLAS